MYIFENNFFLTQVASLRGLLEKRDIVQQKIQRLTEHIFQNLNIDSNYFEIVQQQIWGVTKTVRKHIFRTYPEIKA